MNKIAELKGLWYCPSNKENKVAGTLQLKSDGIILNTIGALDNSFLLNQNFEIIVGETNEGPVTLINSFIKFSNNPHEKIRTTYQAFFINYCIIGESFEKIDDIKFSVCAFRFQFLESWATEHGFKSNFHDYKKNKLGKKFLIDYKQPSQIKLYKNKEIELFLFFSVQQTFAGIHNRTAEISEKTYLNIYFRNQTSLMEIIKLIYSLKTLHTLSISSSSKICEIEFWINKGDSKKIKFFSKEVLEQELPDTSSYSIMALHNVELKEKTSMIFKNWFDKMDKLSSVYELYYYSIYVDQRFGKTEFLNLVFALETMHRSLIGGESINLNVYETLLNKIKTVLNDEEQKLIIDKMKYLYQYSLRTRLKYLANRFEFILKQYNEKKAEFVNKVVYTRNYYVHFDESLKSQIIVDKKFSYYNHILRIFLDSFLLSELGLNNDEISRFIKKQSHLFRFI